MIFISIALYVALLGAAGIVFIFMVMLLPMAFEAIGKIKKIIDSWKEDEKNE